MISPREIKVIDENSDFYGTPPKKLMENAGKGFADFVKKKVELDKKILFFCGKGNNGGDGFVAARYLSKEYDVSVFLVGKEKDIKSKIARENFNKLKQKNIAILDTKSIKKIDQLISENEVIADSMLGIGLSGELREPYATIVKKINHADKTVFSVDVATGIGSKTAVKPCYTVTFHDKKKGMNKKDSGEIKIVDIGVPKKALEYIGPGELTVYYPKPKKKSHKGENGRILVVGGGPFIGAPALSALAGLRTGADLAFITTPKKAAKAITSFSPQFIKPERMAQKTAVLSPNLIVKELKSKEILTTHDVEFIEEFVRKTDAVVIGPGLGEEKETQKAVKAILKMCSKKNKPLVIDADAIKVLGDNRNLLKGKKVVVTPHTGEFKKLTGIKISDEIKDRRKIVERWAKKLGITILLKGPVDIISNGYKTKLNDVHTEAMTTGGTGDVLSGILGALLSKDVSPFNSARIGAFVNGSAGEIGFEKKSYGLVATDIIEEIPTVLRKYL